MKKVRAHFDGLRIEQNRRAHDAKLRAEAYEDGIMELDRMIDEEEKEAKRRLAAEGNPTTA